MDLSDSAPFALPMLAELQDLRHAPVNLAETRLQSIPSFIETPTQISRLGFRVFNL